MRINRRLGSFALLLWAILAARPTAAVSEEEPLLLLRQTLDRQDREERLLHRKIDLGEVRCWTRKGQVYTPQATPPDHIALINLWSVRCEPCREEFPRLRNIAREAKLQGLKIEFWFIADPPDETSEADALSFWQQPPVALPDAVLCRSTGTRLRTSLGIEGVPITLLVDSKQAIRQAFLGSIERRKVAAAMERLLALGTPAAGPPAAAPKRPRHR